MSLSQKVALVTGAGSGIGRAVALELAKNGYAVLFAGRRQSLLEQAAAEGGSACLPLAMDVTDERSVESLFARIGERFGRLDLLFNNAGTAAAVAPIEEVSLEQWRAIIDTNVTGLFLCTRAAVRLMKKQQPQGGRIINNGSLSAHVPRPHMVAYTASKHAVSGITKATALEGRNYNIACGQIDIGNAATSLTASLSVSALQPDQSRKVEPTIDVQAVARSVLYMDSLSLDANVLFLTVMATQMPFVGRG